MVSTGLITRATMRCLISKAICNIIYLMFQWDKQQTIAAQTLERGKVNDVSMALINEPYFTQF